MDMIYGITESLDYDLATDKEIHFHFGWPLSSWLDRLSMGIFSYRLMRLPKKFPRFYYHINYAPILTSTSVWIISNSHTKVFVN